MSLLRTVMRAQAHQAVARNRSKRALSIMTNGSPGTWKLPFRMAWRAVTKKFLKNFEWRIRTSCAKPERPAGQPTTRLRRAARRSAGPDNYPAVTS